MIVTKEFIAAVDLSAHRQMHVVLDHATGKVRKLKAPNESRYGILLNSPDEGQMALVRTLLFVEHEPSSSACTHQDAATRLDDITRAKMTGNPALSFGDAFNEAQAENPQLAREYAESIRH